VRQQFTGQERDDTGLDFFQARYFTSAQGRFASVDPANAGASLGDPQSWNGYAYVSNSPLRFTDPSGEGFWGDIGFFLGAVIGSFIPGANIAVDALFGYLVGNVVDVARGGLSALSPIPGMGSLPGAPPGAGGFGGVFGAGNTGPFIFSATITSFPSTTDISSTLQALQATSIAFPPSAGTGQAITMPFPLIVGGAARAATWAGRLSGIGTVVGLLLMQKGDGRGKAPSKPGAKPRNVPSGTKPIDEMGWSSGRIHGIKNGLGAGPRDWVGIAPNGDVITGDAAGNAVNDGPWTSYVR
jgi:RHS repeat-associated protein